ncbi:uncharacterized protein CDAR_274001 [Caerostris darwini]|uniref:FUN14 family protein n=1 Tax=Caerostris darwini TaxID=1538125 RepID=A0AAV4RHH3_9ARAC|nr:uncharacterized protein CDAR_274001 [Caerostris darwini]
MNYTDSTFASASDNGNDDRTLKQALVGGLCGLVAGRIFSKVSKMAALALSGGFWLLHLLQHQNYIVVDGDKLLGELKNLASNLKGVSDIGRLSAYFGEDCQYIALGFSGGFLLGIS